MTRVLWLAAALSVAACEGSEPFVEAEAAYARADYAAARAAYERALERPSPGIAPARVRAQLGLTLRKLGELEAAEGALRAALEASGEDGQLQAVVRRYLGQVLAARGEREAARVQFDAALAWHREHGPVSELLKVQTSRAGLAWELDDFQSAYDAYSDVYDRAQSLGDAAQEANALDGLALLMGHVGELDAARWLLARAATLHEASGRTEALARSRLNLANLTIEEGRYAEGRALAEQAGRVAEAAGNVLLQAQVQLALANGHLGDALYERALAAADRALQLAGPTDHRGAVEDAWLLKALALAALGRWAPVDDALQALRARSPMPERFLPYVEDVEARRAAARGDLDAELTHRRRAVEAFERQRSRFGPDTLAHFYIRERLAIYQSLLRTLVDQGLTDEAAELVGRIKARALVEDLVRVHRASEHAQGPDRRRLERGLHLRRMAAEVPETKAISLDRLPADVAVLDYYLLPDELLVFWWARDGRQLFRAKVDATELTGQVGVLERGILARGRDYEAPTAWLAERLLDPVAAALNGPTAPRRLCVVPHGALHRVPFEALPWGGGRLLDRFDVFSVPSVPAFLELVGAEAAPAPLSSVLAVGDPVENLPGARLEAGRVARLFPARTVLLGDQALETSVRASMSGADVVHLAVHGVEPTAGRPAWLELQPDSRNDGRLYADEIATLRLKSTLVTLSACDSGVGLPNRGDEIPGVLDRAFLQAGARTVISSRWPVSDAATVLFMDTFYGALATEGRLGAFATAQRALRRGRVSTDSFDESLLATNATRGVRRVTDDARPVDFTHPYFWASFALKGDPR